MVMESGWPKTPCKTNKDPKNKIAATMETDVILPIVVAPYIINNPAPTDGVISYAHEIYFPFIVYNVPNAAPIKRNIIDIFCSGMI